MGKNDGASKKTVQKQKQKVIEDKTFGLKNKNKSKKVQQFVQSVEKTVMNSGDPKLRKLEEQRKAAKAEAKERRKALQAEQEALFGEALLAVQKKSSAANQKDGKIEAKGRDADDGAAKAGKGSSAAMKMMFQMDAQEMDQKLKEDPNYVPTIEDEIELERQKVLNLLRAAGKVGTPVNPETFSAWQERKKLAKAADIKKRVEAELRKKKGGKGLSVLSGRDLYTYKKELFSKIDGIEDGNDTVDGESVDDYRQGADVQSAKATTATGINNGAIGSVSIVSQDDDNAQRKQQQLQHSQSGDTATIQSDLFLQDDVEDLDDIEDDDDD